MKKKKKKKKEGLSYPFILRIRRKSNIDPASHERVCDRLGLVHQTQFKHELHASPNAGFQGGRN